MLAMAILAARDRSYWRHHDEWLQRLGKVCRDAVLWDISIAGLANQI